MPSLDEVRAFIAAGEYYNARVAIEYLDDADELEGKLLKAQLFCLQRRFDHALRAAQYALSSYGAALTPPLRLRALVLASRAAAVDDSAAADAHADEARALAADLSPEERALAAEAIEWLDANGA